MFRRSDSEHNSKDRRVSKEILELLQEVLSRLNGIEGTLKPLLCGQPTKEWFTTAEVAKLLGKAEFTVREWCRHTRLLADKRQYGRGDSKEWIISHKELERYRKEGLLPDPHRYRYPK